MLKTAFVWFILAIMPPTAIAQDKPDAPAQSEASAPATPPTVEEVRAYLEVAGNDQTLTDMAFYGFQVAAEQSGVRASDDQWERVRALVRVNLLNAVNSYLDELTIYYARHSTSEELEAALAYYRSAAGQHYLRTAIGAMVPYLAHVQAHNRPPAGPEEAFVDPARLAASRALWAVIMTRFTPAETAQMSQAGYALAQFNDYMVRTLAHELTVEELESARQWAASPASQRLEGADDARTRATTEAMRHAMRLIDVNTLRSQIQVILSERPT